MSSDFFFSLVRISCAQILRSAGIDRCSPSILNAVADILLRHLDLLSQTASRNARLSGRNEVVIQDVALAMEQVGLIHPYTVLDPWDTDPQATVGFENFIEWAKGPVPAEARRISKMPNQNANQKSSSNAAVAAAAAAQANNPQSNVTTIDEDDEWLVALMKKQSKLGHETRFNGTVLGGEDATVENDAKIAGTNGTGPAPPW
jgi:transcription initiation factor TFIID subunit 3